ncbi:MAG: isochorismate synthase [bacterium]
MIIQKPNNRKSIFYHHIHPNFLNSFYQSSIINCFPIAVWRLPGKSEKQAIIDLSGNYSKINIDIAKIPKGFIISPFFNNKNKSTILIKANLYLNNTFYTYLHEPDDLTFAQIIKNKLRFEHTLEKLLKTKESDTIDNGPRYVRNWYTKETPKSANSQVIKNEFCHWVEKAKEQIKTDLMKKVVLSRTLEVDLKNDFNALTLFNKLCSAYPNAFVSLIAIPGIGSWIGATPELLLSVTNHQLSTVALAGTQLVSSTTKLSSIKWVEKELKEQAFVSEFIRNCLLQQNITDITEHGPETVQAGNLLHLQTKFKAQLSVDKHHDTINRILMDLHPTPAVCGVPKTEALDFILNLENHDREYYAGFLGPVNIDNQTHLYVNLRCMQMKTDTAILYAGSGITIDSEPEKEWWETELKLNILLNYINNTSNKAQSKFLKISKTPELDRVFWDEKV